MAAILVGSGILGLTYAFASIPLPRELDLDASAEVYDLNDRLIGTFSGEVRRFLMDTDKLPNYVGEAVVAAEDRDFYEHDGVSLRGIIRATWANVTGGEIRQGGSTITQQYVKTAILKDPSRTLSRKVKEAILAIKLERQYSKKQILGFYLNTIYLGRGAYGIKAAARTYFDKPAPKLTLGEAAYLAGIIPSPESYQVDSNPDDARARRDRVLNQMVAEGYITQREADKASHGKVKVAKQGESFKRQDAAYFLEWLRKDYLYPEYGSDLFTGGLKIYTTLDPEMQEQAESAVASVLDDGDDPEASLVASTPKGEVRAFVGGRAFESVKKARGFNYASDPPGRQAGSAFKTFTLAAAVEEGISPQSRFSGASPKTITEPACSGPEGLWEPENYGGSSYGSLTVDQATTNSVNVVYAQLAAEVGPDNVADVVADFGFDRQDAPRGLPKRDIAPNCSLALGTLDVTPVEMARAYAAFAARGALPDIMPIRYITNSDGDCLKKYRPERGVDCDEEADFKVEKVIEQNTADVVTQTLTHVVQGGTATVASLPGRPVAGKTGTTQENVDAWFAGYTPQLVTVVWEGYPAERGGNLVPQMGYCSDTDLCRPVDGYEVTGGGTPVSPAVIWYNFMVQATADMEVVPFPVPTDLPDTVINSAPPPPPPAPKPKKSEEPKEEPTEEPPEEEPSQPPSPSDDPSMVPTPTNEGNQGRRREKEP